MYIHYNERVGGAAFLPHKGSTVGDMCSAGMPNLLHYMKVFHNSTVYNMYDNERVGGAAFLPHKGSTVCYMCSAGMPNLLIETPLNAIYPSI